MTMDTLSAETQEGLRRWAKVAHHDEMLFDGIGGAPEQWAWIWFQLQVAEDRPEWFPKGKWATVQFIGGQLIVEAARGLFGTKATTR